MKEKHKKTVENKIFKTWNVENFDFCVHTCSYVANKSEIKERKGVQLNETV